MTGSQLEMAVQAARRVVAQADAEMHLDPHRLAWARNMLAYFDTRDAAIARRLHISAPQQPAAAA